MIWMCTNCGALAVFAEPPDDPEGSWECPHCPREAEFSDDTDDETQGART